MEFRQVKTTEGRTMFLKVYRMTMLSSIRTQMEIQKGSCFVYCCLGIHLEISSLNSILFVHNVVIKKFEKHSARWLSLLYLVSNGAAGA
jgi:hypothetical protein